LIKLINENIDQYFIKLDKKLVLIGNDLCAALDVLYKTFHVFNIEIPPKAKNIFGFFDLIYDMKSTASSATVLLFDNIKKRNI
jgi:hypothetical protein